MDSFQETSLDLTFLAREVIRRWHNKVITWEKSCTGQNLDAVLHDMVIDK